MEVTWTILLPEFIRDVNWGMDIDVQYKDIKLHIMGYKHKINIGRIHTSENAYFDNADDMLDNFLIDGKPMRERLPEMVYFDN